MDLESFNKVTEWSSCPPLLNNDDNINSEGDKDRIQSDGPARLTGSLNLHRGRGESALLLRFSKTPRAIRRREPSREDELP